MTTHAPRWLVTATLVYLLPACTSADAPSRTTETEATPAPAPFPRVRSALTRMKSDARLPKTLQSMREDIGLSLHHGNFPLNGEFDYRAAIAESGYPAVVEGRRALGPFESSTEAQLAVRLLTDYLAGDALLRRYLAALQAREQERASACWDELASHTEAMRTTKKAEFKEFGEAFDLRAQALKDRFKK